MNDTNLIARLDFIRKAEQLKETYRSAHTSAGNIESVAEHTWRLLLLLITYADCYPDVDLCKLLQIGIIHDLGEVVGGDIPAPKQVESKSVSERVDFESLLSSLPVHVRDHFLSLWDEYENAATPEARLAKAFDKIETIMQHNQGLNPADFDYRFNLQYGKHFTDAIDLTRSIRGELDHETSRHAENQANALNLSPVQIKAFVPAIDYPLSKSFYQDFGFTMASDEAGIAFFHLGTCSFLLQQVEQRQPRCELIMHLQVENADHWHQHLINKEIAVRYEVTISAVQTQPWGMRDFILSDPSGVTWRVAHNI